MMVTVIVPFVEHHAPTLFQALHIITYFKQKLYEVSIIVLILQTWLINSLQMWKHIPHKSLILS